MARGKLHDSDYDEEETWIGILKSLNVSDGELALKELGVHLRRQFSDARLITPRRFEELVGDVYRNLGFSVRITAQTHDGGFDLVLVERSTGEQILVECKRYTNGAMVGVDLVRQLIGVQLLQDIPRAKLVTTGNFTSQASRTAQRADSRGLELELIHAGQLIEMLGVYNHVLPPLTTELRKRGHLQ